MHKPLRIFSALPTLLLLAACGDGSLGNDNGDNIVTPPVVIPKLLGGIWVNGSVTPDSGSSLISDPAISILTTDSGAFRLISSTAVQAEGTISLIDNDQTQLTGDITAYMPQGFFFSDSAATSDCSIDGMLFEASSISGRFSCADPNDTGTFTATYGASLYERDSALTLLEGTWGRQDGSMTFILDDAGNLQPGSGLSNGCVITGKISIIDSNTNLYNFNLDFDTGGTPTTCAELTGIYSGLGYLQERTGASDLLTYQIDNGTIINTEVLTRAR
jgi:hypothetical protein